MSGSKAATWIAALVPILIALFAFVLAAGQIQARVEALGIRVERLEEHYNAIEAGLNRVQTDLDWIKRRLK